MSNSKDRLSAIVSAIPGVAVVFSEEGRYLEILAYRGGLSPDRVEQLPGTLMTDYLTVEQARPLTEGIRKALETGQPHFLEYVISFATEDRWFEARVAPVPQANPDDERAVVWIANDITDRKRMEEKLKRSNEELEKFAYVASHDLRAPLRAIENLAAWIDEDAGEVLPAESREHLALLQQRVQRMDRLICGLLDYSRVARGLSLQPVDVGEVVRHAMDLLDPAAGGFRFEVAQDFPQIDSDPLLLQQIIQNLLGNAVKHHHRDHGVISVGWRRWADQFVLKVRDDGPGIEPAHQERIFEIFQTLKSRDETEASGIGLSIVRKAVQALGGTIALRSPPEGGTEIEVALPGRSNARIEAPEVQIEAMA